MSAPLTELTLLGTVMVWGLIQLLWAALAARAQQGYGWGVGPRDDTRPLRGTAARLDRAFKNFLETFPFFAAAVLMVTQMGKHGTLTLVGSALYVAGRVVYVPLYAVGVPYLRTVVWQIATAGLFMVIAALFV